MFKEISEGIDKFELDKKPTMFEEDPNHTCITFHHKVKVSEEEKLHEKEEKKVVSAAKLMLHLVDTNNLSCLSRKMTESQKNKGVEGFKIDAVDYFPDELRSDYMLATESFSTTEGKKKVRVRYIPSSRLSQDDIQLVSAHLSSFQHLYYLTVKKQKEKTLAFAHGFRQMLTNSCTLFER